MSTKATAIQHADFVSVNLDVVAPDLLTIGVQMRQINPEALMNGYNWDAFIDRYLAMNYPIMREGLDRDPEPGTYVGLYANDALGNKKADTLVKILNDLIAKPEKIYAYMQEDGDGVEWV